LSNYIDELHKSGLHFVSLVDSGFIKSKDYSAYTDGVDNGVFIRSAANNSEPFIGRGLGGDIAFADFMNNETAPWWKSLLTDFFEDCRGFDGLWLVRNELQSDCDGICYPDQQVVNGSFNHLDYIPAKQGLEVKNLDLDAVYRFDSGNETGPAGTEIDAHSTYSVL
jgi:alpha-glucosidase (family GH31 glycosyl hydrolase)